MVRIRGLFAVLLLVLPVVVFACEPWHEMPFEALQRLSPCVEPAVYRQVGKACLRHEWLCGQSRFKDWFEQWMAELDEPIAMETRSGQLIFSGQERDTAWALFWMPVHEQAQGFVVLLSRIREAASKE